ncbi:hypothetical protein L3Q82_011732, partial [Scortum barcoo]
VRPGTLDMHCGFKKGIIQEHKPAEAYTDSQTNSEGYVYMAFSHRQTRALNLSDRSGARENANFKQNDNNPQREKYKTGDSNDISCSPQQTLIEESILASGALSVGRTFLEQVTVIFLAPTEAHKQHSPPPIPPPHVLVEGCVQCTAVLPTKKRLRAVHKPIMNRRTSRTVTSPGLALHRGPTLEPGLGLGLAGERLVAGSLPTGPGRAQPEMADVGPPSSRLTTRRKVHEGPVQCGLGSSRGGGPRRPNPWTKTLAIGTWNVTSLGGKEPELVVREG